jgi:hypothetical protein
MSSFDIKASELLLTPAVLFGSCVDAPFLIRMLPATNGFLTTILVESMGAVEIASLRLLLLYFFMVLTSR